VFCVGVELRSSVRVRHLGLRSASLAVCLSVN